MKRELIQILEGEKKVHIQTHNFPDPDAIASAFALQQYIRYYGIESDICYDGKLERSNAKRMLENFGIQISPVTERGHLDQEDAVILIDSQNLNANVTDIGGKKVACIDHHPIFVKYDYLYQDIRMVGACASILASYFKEDGIPIGANVAAALAYAIKMDTADFTRGTTQMDTEMFSYLFEYADWKRVQYMYNNTLELADLRAYEAAIQSIEVYDKVGFAHIPFDCHPALIAIISDFVKALDEVNIAVIYAMQEDGVRFSVRSEEDKVNVGILLKDILSGIGDGGGHPAMAGGFISKESAERLGERLHHMIKERFMQGIQEMRDSGQTVLCDNQ